MENDQHIPIRDAEKKHQHELVFQILVPLLAIILLVLTVATLAIVSSVNNSVLSEKWAQISTIMLILPGLLIGIVLLAAVIFSSVTTKKLISTITLYLGLFSSRFQQTATTIQSIANNSLTPVIKVNAFKAGVGQLLWIFQKRKIQFKEKR